MYVSVLYQIGDMYRYVWYLYSMASWYPLFICFCQSSLTLGEFNSNLFESHSELLFVFSLHFCSWSSECYILYIGSVVYPVPEHCCYCGRIITWQPCICWKFRAHSSSRFHVNYFIEGSWSGDQHLLNRSCTFWKCSSTHSRALVLKNY